jgi:predicted PurR-regulated permease PerM
MGERRRQLVQRWQAAIEARSQIDVAPEMTAALASAGAGGAEDDPVRVARVPYGIDLAAAWSWRLLIIGAAVLAGGWVISTLSPIAIPVAVSILLAALATPVVDWMSRLLPRKLAALVVVTGGLALVIAMLGLAGQQVATGSTDLADQVVSGLDKIRAWLQDGPLHVSDTQINDFFKSLQDFVLSGSDTVASRVSDVGSAVGHLVAGFFIVLFSTYFFLADGAAIWSWVVRIFPRAARAEADSSGRVAWLSLTKFVRATVLVAFTDAVGIMLVAVILRVPFVAAIGVLVFLGAFVPLVGATVSGSVAVLVALVAQGPLAALLMLGGVILVQQLEAHVLQPFLMGRFVAVHPLGIILAIGVGVLVAGIVGALIAVPLAAAANAVVLHLADLRAQPPADPG